MNLKEVIDKNSLFIKQNLLTLALGLVGLILFSYGLISLFLSLGSTREDIVFEAKENNSENISNSSENQDIKSVNLTVDIEGSVVRPGVYHLPLDSRVQDVLLAAGGLAADADRDFISKNINLATKLSDGAKIYIPGIGEDTKSITGDIMGEQININTASEEILDSLPGIGPVTIQKIVSSRPYSSIDDLLDKKIVGSKVFSEIKEKISVY